MSTHPKAFSPRASATLSALLAACDLEPANDNAGAAWEASDARPDHDDDRVTVRVRTRAAADLEPVLAMGLAAGGVWHSYGVCRADGVALRFAPRAVASRGTWRRVAAVAAILRAGGLDVARW